MNLLHILRIGRWGVLYFAILFGIGFMLGPIRVYWLEPRVGVRIAELIESPFMLLAIILAGRWVGRQLGIGYTEVSKLAVGAVAAVLILGADLLVGVGLRKMSALEVFISRDPISGFIYYLLVALAAVTPWMMSRATAKGS